MMIYKSHAFAKELEKKQQFLAKMPKILFKYRPFDKHAFEMLEHPYVYLASAKGLDDPFDCFVSPGSVENLKTDKNEVSMEMFNFILRTVSSLGNTKVDKAKMKQMVLPCFKNGELDEDLFKEQLKKENGVQENEKDILQVALLNLFDGVKASVGDPSMMSFASIALKETEKIGICSLSTKKDNKVMWSLYGDEYAGYCAEYEIPNLDDVRYCLYPVMYKKKDDNNIQHKLITFVLANIIRFVSNGALNNSVGTMFELFCTKDRDWQYQDEWRIIGDAGYHFKFLKLKAVYLGFKVSKYKTAKIKRYSKINNYTVYKMNEPSGSKKITYKKI